MHAVINLLSKTLCHAQEGAAQPECDMLATLRQHVDMEEAAPAWSAVRYSLKFLSA